MKDIKRRIKNIEKKLNVNQEPKRPVKIVFFGDKLPEESPPNVRYVLYKDVKR